MRNGYAAEDGSRKIRADNNAHFYCKNYDKWEHDEIKAVSFLRIRDEQRKDIGLPELPDGEDKWGDYRAHGDAMGGHELKLERVVYRGTKCALVNERNLKICKDRLKRRDRPDNGILL